MGARPAVKNLVFVNGIMDAGKSTVARQLLARYAAAYQLVLMTDDTPRREALRKEVLPLAFVIGRND